MRKPTIAPLCLAITLAAPALAVAAPQQVDAASANRFQKKQSPPISLGTSGGNALDFEIDPPFISCSSGTLGALIEKNGVQYVLSNNHVMAMQNEAEVGDPVNQPGLIDHSPLCDFSDDDIVADLTGWKKIKFGGRKNNRVDAAIAEARPGMVKTSGEILRIGQPGNDYVAATPGLEVKKAGRTTGVTRARVVATGVTGTVLFSGPGDDEDVEAKFVKQIVIDGRGQEIFSGGDSGAVFFEDVADCPRAVGLGFAGSESGDLALASPMKAVLKAMTKVRPKAKATMVGCEPLASAGFTAATASAALWDERALDVRQARRVQKRHESEVLAMSEVAAIGVGHAAADPREVVFKVFVTGSEAAARDRIPDRIEGIRTEIVVTGRFLAY